ncbi:MAG: MBOAT family O-acyltransferase [Bacteroidales bacterium]
MVFLLFSIVFYALRGALEFIFYLLGSTLINFYIVQGIYTAKTRRIRRLLGATSIFINMGLLAYFKYANFFVDNLDFLIESFGGKALPWTEVLLPIGISFFTFQSLTYTIDVYRKVSPPLKNPMHYVLYIIMFPQLIAGPIVRFQTIAEQLVDRRETYDDRLIGFYRFVIGLAKKVLIADVLGMRVDQIMNAEFYMVDTPTAWVGIVAYSFQIYFDFSGYSDMAIGMGRMLGFRFPENFDNPYVSGSITEFWRRWHMTFTTFMRYYLYYPLGGNRVNSAGRLYFNLMFVFLVSGLWHGASWNFVIWGAVHGLFLILERLFLLKILQKIGRFPSMLYTFIVVMFAWIPFRVEGLHEAVMYFNRLFEFKPGDFMFESRQHFYFILVVAIGISYITSFKLGLKTQDALYKTDQSPKQHIAYFSVAVLTLILVIASLSGSGFSPFIYFRF